MNFIGKKGLIFGVANHRSIAYHIAKVLSDRGASIGYSYQNERVLESVKKSVKRLPVQLSASRRTVATVPSISIFEIIFHSEFTSS